MSDEPSKAAGGDENIEALWASLKSDRKVITISFSQTEGVMGIMHDGMNSYEALGLLVTATDLLRNDMSLIPAPDDDEDA